MNDWNAFDSGKPEDIEHKLGEPIVTIWWVDEVKSISEVIEEVPDGVKVHLLRANDHRPGCWAITQSGPYAVTLDYTAITCDICYALTHAANPGAEIERRTNDGRDGSRR